MKTLCIKGNETRYNEVIEILKMLGGDNRYNLKCDTNKWYVLYNGIISYCDYLFNEDEKGYTIDEFWGKYPYRVGDKVKFNPNYFNIEETTEIVEMEWDYNRGEILYYTKRGINGYVNDFIPYIEEDNVEKCSVIRLNNKIYGNNIEIDLGEYEINEKDGKVYAILKKKEYPKNSYKCLEILGIESMPFDFSTYNKDIIYNFQELLVCRNAYWKLYGEEMGLGKPWEPDWEDDTTHKFIIHTIKDKICCGLSLVKNHTFAFPSEKIRDDFYTNFKQLIEKCKKLL
jgi:hypothetical protein